MPLPPALAARLAKRGIIDQTPQDKDEIEEVFVEHYDEESRNEKPEPMETSEPDPPAEPDILVYEKRACPNQSNSFHKCVDFCTKKWGLCKFEPNSDMEPKKAKMLTKYPIPGNWDEVGDPTTHRYYYWNTDTDEVSWMPPQHPKASISLPADKLKELMEAAKKEHKVSDESEGEQSNKSESESDSDDSAEELGDIDMDDFEALERELLKEREKKEKEQQRSSNKRVERKKKEDVLDPMDPASYSDIPRGKWSDGLPTTGDAKTGVDATASGPLFQQRPYPSPGDIMRMQQQKK